MTKVKVNLKKFLRTKFTKFSLIEYCLLVGRVKLNSKAGRNIDLLEKVLKLCKRTHNYLKVLE